MKEFHYSKYHEESSEQSRKAVSRMPYKYKEVTRGSQNRKKNSERLVF